MEPICAEDNSRFTVFPVQYRDLYEAYERQENSFWQAGDIYFAGDVDDFRNKLTDNERWFLEHVLAFFAGADGIVYENLVTNFLNEIKIPEARLFYGLQAAMENIHGITYSKLIDTFVESNDRKLELFNAIDNIQCVRDKADWALKWFDTSRPIGERLVAFAAVEGIFFSGSFCAIFYLKKRGLMLQALAPSNELISRDEGMHTEFAILLYNYVVNKPSQATVHEIFREAVNIEKQFICDSIPCPMLGMNAHLMCDYIEFITDKLLLSFGFETMYGEGDRPCPFPWMEKLDLEGKTNFFERRVTEYTMDSAFGSVAEASNEFLEVDDF